MLAALLTNLPHGDRDDIVHEPLPPREPTPLELQIVREEDEILILLMDLST